MPLMLESTTLLNDNTIDLIIGVGTVYLTLTFEQSAARFSLAGFAFAKVAFSAASLSF